MLLGPVSVAYAQAPASGSLSPELANQPGLLRTLQGHKDASFKETTPDAFVRAACFSSDGKEIATSTDGGIATIWDVANEKIIRSFEGIPDRGGIVSVAFSPEGKSILVSGKGSLVYLYDAKTGAQIRTLSGHTDNVTSAIFSPDGKYIVTGSSDTTAKVWSVDRALNGNGPAAKAAEP